MPGRALRYQGWVDTPDLDVVRDWAALAGGNLAVALSDEAFRRAARAQLSPFAAPAFHTEAEGSVFEYFGGRREGVDGLIEGWRTMTGRYESFYVDVVSTDPLAGGRVLVPLDIRFRPAGGAEARIEAAGLFTLEGGRIARLQMFGRRSEALAAAGIVPAEG